MAASEKNQRIVWGMFAARCAICQEHLVERVGNASSSVGEVAHIVGEKEGAARGKSDLNLSERNDVDNLMLLCRKHHKVIDDNEEAYTVERLHRLRDDHLVWLADSLTSPQPWRVGISQYAYLNVPRLDEFANLQGYEIRREPIESGATLRSLGFELNYLISSYRRSLEAMEIAAIPVSSVEVAHENYIGQLVSLKQLRCRTKNMPSRRPEKVSDGAFSGDLTRDPHIYHQFGDWKLVVNINPRWVTTDTAYGLFRPQGGASTFTGFARITQVDYADRTMIATGLALGLPPSLLEQAREVNEEALVSKGPGLADLENPKVAARGVYFSPAPSSCDLCSRLFEEFMIDGAIKGMSGWGCLCEKCFVEYGKGLGIGYGQLFRKTQDGWLMIAGAPEEDPDEL